MTYPLNATLTSCDLCNGRPRDPRGFISALVYPYLSSLGNRESEISCSLFSPLSCLLSCLESTRLPLPIYYTYKIYVYSNYYSTNSLQYYDRAWVIRIAKVSNAYPIRVLILKNPGWISGKQTANLTILSK